MKVQISKESIICIADYIKYLSLMAIQRANSGHPGLPLGCARLGAILYSQFLNHSKEDFSFVNRDRFVLSAGHGSMLLYACNYIFDYGISLQDIASFRQLHSVAAGHPEYEIDKGIETTTGPLGQGIANAVGMAIEQKILKEKFPEIDYDIYSLVGDGCLMEGISYEACSLAGHLGLDNLIAIYDSNQISIDGSTDITFTENVVQRFQSQGWEVLESNGEQIEDLKNKLSQLKEDKNNKPKLLVMHTKIGQGLKTLQGSNKVHGAPTGIEEICYFIENSSLKNEKEFQKENLMEWLQEAIQNGDFIAIEKMSFYGDVQKIIEEKNKVITLQKKQFQNIESNQYFNFQLQQDLKQKLLNYRQQNDATRGVSSNVLQICCDAIENLVGGSADLVGSTKATVKKSDYFSTQNRSGRNIAFGVREHAMGSIGNGLALNKVIIPFTSTFFTFFDYMKTSVRLAALMNLKHLFIFTHDSFHVGEDGPTHQPIEHLTSMRLIPNLTVFRPCNDEETAFAYLYFLQNQSPVAIICTRQKLNEKLFNSPLQNQEEKYAQFCRGAMVVEEDENAQIVLTATGSEIATLVEAKEKLNQENVSVKLVSITSLELLENSETEFQNKIFGNFPVYFLEAASYRGFTPFVSKQFCFKTLQSFGNSACDKDVTSHLGFDLEGILKDIRKIVK